MSAFNQARKRNFERLDQFVPVVARVHGGSHPEFHDVKRLYEEINEKTKAAGSDKPNLDTEFEELRKITDNYKVPGDVCESYEAVYKMLEEVDEAYKA